MATKSLMQLHEQLRTSHKAMKDIESELKKFQGVLGGVVDSCHHVPGIQYGSDDKQPTQFFFTLFFAQVAIGCLEQIFGPFRQLTIDSKCYSTRLPPRVSTLMLPHVTVQCPVYKENLGAVIAPTVKSIKQAISTYELQGGSAKILINDDGLQLINEEDPQLRDKAKPSLSCLAREPYLASNDNGDSHLGPSEWNCCGCSYGGILPDLGIKLPCIDPKLRTKLKSDDTRNRKALLDASWIAESPSKSIKIPLTSWMVKPEVEFPYNRLIGIEKSKIQNEKSSSPHYQQLIIPDDGRYSVPESSRHTELQLA